jgi:sulfonate transport system ATP-binding protein
MSPDHSLPTSHPTYDPAESAVRVRDLHRSPSDRGALHGIDLDVRHGEFVAVLGQPGAGKTTLLRALAGEDRSTGSGTVRVPARIAEVGPVVGRSLSPGVELLLADDPFAALDAITRARMHLLLRTLWQAQRPTVVFVTHDVEEALLLAQRAVVLERGRVRCQVALPRLQRGTARYDELRALLLAEVEHGAVHHGTFGRVETA